VSARQREEKREREKERERERKREREWKRESERDTGWRRCIGCLTLQIIFRKRAPNYRALLRKEISKE